MSLFLAVNLPIDDTSSIWTNILVKDRIVWKIHWDSEQHRFLVDMNIHGAVMTVMNEIEPTWT